MLYPVSFKALKSFFNCRKGQGLVEYGLILVLVAVVVIVILQALGVQITDTFNTVTTEFTNAG